jgi:hypothetical protein
MCYFSAKLRTVESVQKCRFAILRLLLLHRADLCFASKKKGSMEGGRRGTKLCNWGKVENRQRYQSAKRGKGGRMHSFFAKKPERFNVLLSPFS